MDIKTVLISYLITNAVCTGVLVALYWQNRKQFKGLGYWLAYFVLQFVALLLTVLGEAVPEVMSVGVGNGLVIGGTILFYMGLEHFTGKRGPQGHNALLFILFIAIQAYFVVFSPNLTARNVNFALALFVICAQCAWLLIYRVDIHLRAITRDAGLVFAAYMLVSAGQVFVDLASPPSNHLFFSSPYDSLVVMIYQTLFIMLTFILFLMVNRRLLIDLQRDIFVRRQTEEALRFGEEKYMALFEKSAVPASLTKMPEGVFVDVNEAFQAMFGYTRQEVIGKTSIGIGITLPQECARAYTDLRQRGGIQGSERHLRTKTGGKRNCLINVNQVQIGGQDFVITSFHDITEHKRAEEELRESEIRERARANELAAVLEAVPAIVWIAHDPESKYITGSLAAAEFLRMPLDANLSQTAPPDERPRHFTVWKDGKETKPNELPVQLAAKGITVKDYEEEVVFDDGTRRYLIGNASPLYDARGQIHGAVAAFRDITEYKRAEKALRESEEKYRRIVETAQEGIWVLDAEGKTSYINAHMAEMLGYPPMELMGHSLFEFMDDDARKDAEALLERRRQGISEQHEFRFRRKNGTDLWAIVSTNAMVNEDSDFIGALGMIIDITERKQATDALRQANETLQMQLGEINALKETLQEQVLRDPLTHLHNRRYLNETLGHETARAQRDHYSISITMIDIDHFKGFNDTYGHSTGDEVLKALSHLLVERTRQGDITCRYGGEEFLIVMVGAHDADVARRAEEIRYDFSQLRIPFDKEELSATISVGVAFYPQHGAEIQQVIDAADAAMYQAKQAGRNRVQIWQPDE